LQKSANCNEIALHSTVRGRIWAELKHPHEECGAKIASKAIVRGV